MTISDWNEVVSSITNYYYENANRSIAPAEIHLKSGETLTGDMYDSYAEDDAEVVYLAGDNCTYWIALDDISYIKMAAV